MLDQRNPGRFVNVSDYFVKHLLLGFGSLESNFFIRFSFGFFCQQMKVFWFENLTQQSIKHILSKHIVFELKFFLFVVSHLYEWEGVTWFVA